MLDDSKIPYEFQNTTTWDIIYFDKKQAHSLLPSIFPYIKHPVSLIIKVCSTEKQLQHPLEHRTSLSRCGAIHKTCREFLCGNQCHRTQSKSMGVVLNHSTVPWRK